MDPQGAKKFKLGRVILDVGGHRFKTTSTTLTKEPDTMLAAMFSGRHELIPEEDGAYFIDRDGTHFRYILNYLRDGDTDCLPTDKAVLKELLQESKFYQIERLIADIGKLLNPELSQSEVVKELDLVPCELPFDLYSDLDSGDARLYICWCPAKAPLFDDSIVSNVSFSNVYFNHRLSFQRSILKNIDFRECYFEYQLDFSEADLTDVSLNECGNLVGNLPIVKGASQHSWGLTIDDEPHKST